VLAAKEALLPPLPAKETDKVSLPPTRLGGDTESTGFES
jgi:hypothetical protein